MFPDIIVEALKTHVANLPGAIAVVNRPLRNTDENGSVGIVDVGWDPIEYEMGGLSNQPSLVDYPIIIEHLVKHESEEEGRALLRAFAKSLISMLYDGQEFNVAFRALTDSSGARTERIQRWKVTTQRNASNKIAGQYMGMSSTELSVQVQAV